MTIYIQRMTMAVISIKTDDEIKQQIQELAKEFGISVSGLINLRMRDFLRHKSINISVDDSMLAYYQDNDTIQVNEKVETVLDFLESLDKRDV